MATRDFSQRGPGESHITAIDVDYIRPRLAASHLLIDHGRAAFVDPGTTHAIPLLREALRVHSLSVADVDYVLLTHIHLDHAGGAGALMQQLPSAKCVVHPRGAGHLVDPAKLIAGSRAVYGDAVFARLYGEITPIPQHRLRVVEDGAEQILGERTLQFIHTAGHALHHYCIVDPTAQVIFAGDTFGISYREFDTASGAFIFPGTTPVQFDPAAAHASIDRLLSYAPRAIYLMHYSRVTPPAELATQLHRGIDEFVAIARRAVASTPELRRAQMCSEMYTYMSAQLDAHGYTGDETERHRLLDGDIDLNVDGLIVWIDRLRKAASH